MHRIPFPLKVGDQPPYAVRREGIKGHDSKPTEVSDFFV
jgi:hypothetical protein